MKKSSLVLIAIALAIFLGSIIDSTSWIYPILDVVGTLFIQALTLVVVPLVMASIISGVVRIALDEEFGKLGFYTFSSFILLNLLAILIGVLVGDFFRPGVGVEIQLMAGVTLPETQGGAISNLLLDIIPSNILDAFAKGKMLSLIFFSMIYGFAITRISQNAYKVQKRLWQGIFDAMLKITNGIMVFLPLGVFCLVAKVFANLGSDTLKPMIHFIWTALLGLALFSFVAIPLILKFIAQINFREYLKAITPALITAFSTSSSTAALPVTLECMEEKVGVSNRICSLVIPLGTSINLSCTALYNALGGIFISQVFGLPITITSQLALIFVTLILSFGIASIPGGGLIAALTLVNTLNLPPEGFVFFVALDRLLDMFRSTANVFAYTTSTILVARGAGESKILYHK